MNFEDYNYKNFNKHILVNPLIKDDGMFNSNRSEKELEAPVDHLPVDSDGQVGFPIKKNIEQKVDKLTMISLNSSVKEEFRHNELDT